MRYFQRYVRYECKVFWGSKDIPWAHFETITRSSTHPTTKTSTALVNSCLFWRFLGYFYLQLELGKKLVNIWSLLFQKGTQSGIFNFFHFWFFVAFNSRDVNMLWVLNLYSRSSPTKLWKQIFDLTSQKNFFDTQSWHVRNFSRNGSMGNVKFEWEISMKTFVSTKIFYVL